MSLLLKGHSAEALETAIAAALTALHGSPVEVTVGALEWQEPDAGAQFMGQNGGTLRIGAVQVREADKPPEPSPF